MFKKIIYKRFRIFLQTWVTPCRTLMTLFKDLGADIFRLLIIYKRRKALAYQSDSLQFCIILLLRNWNFLTNNKIKHFNGSVVAGSHWADFL